ncbi:MAG: hypothetical protein ACSHWW_05190 [Nonlabens sp.]|uniref:hypothetical protein n=1 Tax=Nonlabens sp. TaxID=1888209 RepID=UPI003EF147AC
MKYSKRSFHFAWISIVLASMFLIFSQISRDGSTEFDMLISYLITFQYMSILIGFACAIMSRKEEKTQPQRWAYYINILLFAIMAGYFIFSYVSKAS